MKVNDVNNKEGILYFFKMLFNNTSKEENMEEIIEGNDDNISTENKKEFEESQKRLEEMIKEYSIENFEVSSREKTPKVKKAKYSDGNNLQENKEIKAKRKKQKQQDEELEI